MVAETAITEPDYIQASIAINAASEMLNSAKEKMKFRDYGNSFEDARNVIRIAVSALMFKDGMIVQTFDATIQYLNEKYPETFPVEKWKSIEKTMTGEGPGLVNRIIEIIGKKPREADAGDAVKVANEFLNTVKKLV
ncbi:hypothetical protein JXA56_05620 [Candidatus Micrarchaeota archaeon]|nr:hypothetical protein [Candidatus Micrarchaeota archaeon]